MATILYIKMEQSYVLRKPDVILEDIATIYCCDLDIKNAVEKISVCHFEKSKNGRKVISVLKILELIQKEYKELQIENLGEVDTIVTYECKEEPAHFVTLLKIAFVAVTAFLGAAFTIMTYNNDVGVDGVFRQMHFLFTGNIPTTASIGELTYCVGLAIGLVVFFNHAGHKKFSQDPTPLEVEMRMYEHDVNQAIIIGKGRKGEEIDVS